jgi:hypothetical protein
LRLALGVWSERDARQEQQGRERYLDNAFELHRMKAIMLHAFTANRLPA